MTTAPTITPRDFAQKWRNVATTEKASSHSHFIDLRRMVGDPTPHEADPTGERHAFEKRASGFETGHRGREPIDDEP